MSVTSERLKQAKATKEQKGYWSDFPEYPRADWRLEVANEDTLQGYWDWVMNRIVEDTEEYQL